MEEIMKKTIRVVVQCVDNQTEKVIDTVVCREDAIEDPKNINDLGYLHVDQIGLISSIQDFKIKHQAVLINQSDVCPKCKGKACSLGLRSSKFHSALTDHIVVIRRRRCKCGWGSPYTLDGLYGSTIHPDLLEKQAIQGAENSYGRASKNLNAESKSTRPINNDDRIRRSGSKVSKVIEVQKLQEPKEIVDSARNLIAVIDGGHVKSKAEDTRSFEAMISTVYNPDNIKFIDKNHNEITQKTSVASALSDKQITIKKLTLIACKKEGMSSKITTLTCLTDGARNCWSIANSLKPHAKKTINILDWFHITKRFTIIDKTILGTLKDRLSKVKGHLWHGNSKVALIRLKSLIKDVGDDTTSQRLTDLYEYIDRNQDYLVNYQKRQTEKLPFASSYAETSVNSLINVRQKCNQKMQWSRSGSHDILQIRTSIFSNMWANDWKSAQESLYKKAA